MNAPPRLSASQRTIASSLADKAPSPITRLRPIGRQPRRRVNLAAVGILVLSAASYAAVAVLSRGA